MDKKHPSHATNRGQSLGRAGALTAATSAAAAAGLEPLSGPPTLTHLG